uniref:Myb/SANT-like DNA-binding domain-containing protein n=1 Tax=Knipowitschia caucasica TaxID=637954 RepID=A0AAV2K5U1_KNICA
MHCELGKPVFPNEHGADSRERKLQIMPVLARCFVRVHVHGMVCIEFINIGTTEKTFALINYRAANEANFMKTKFQTKSLWQQAVKELGLEGKVTHKQVSKKWENLKKRYKGPKDWLRHR